MNITLLGIDIAKNSFQLYGVNAAGEQVVSKKVSREKLLSNIVKLPMNCRVVMEACGSANHWARTIGALGYEVKLISPQYVKPFVKRNKNDERDAEAIATAAQNKQMTYVSAKSLEQQDIQSLLRVREQTLSMKTQVSNQLRGLMSEYGCIVKKGYKDLRKELPLLFDRGHENGLTVMMKEMLERQYELLLIYEKTLRDLDTQLEGLAKADAVCERIMEIEGIGVLSALAIISLVGDGSGFKNGRHFSAYLGLVPGQHSSGARQILTKISKRGDRYLRQLLIHGGRSVLIKTGDKTDSRSVWIKQLRSRKHFNQAAVAIANKNARIAMSLILSGERYRKAA